MNRICNVSGVKTGLEVLLGAHARLIGSRRVGLLTHAAAVGPGLRSAIDLIHSSGLRLTALFGPEHGVRGDAQAGEPVPLRRDPCYCIPVFSLYGQDMPSPEAASTDLDAHMRRFDSRKQGKILTRSMLADVEVMLCDLQDVGTRVYTYVATLIYAMETCSEAGIDLIVLDRPNPIGGICLEGPLLEYPAFASPVGALPVPLRHGMTIGELALLANDVILAGRAKLKIIALRGWRRRLWFDQTGLAWVPTSPNMPTLDTAAVYPGMVFFEGTNVSEGRGTTRPFEIIGAPWLDGLRLAEKLNALQLPGVVFRPAWFTPAFSKYAGHLCSGIQIHVIHRRRFRAFAAMLHMIEAIMTLHPGQLQFHAGYFDRIMGTAMIRRSLEAGAAVAAILGSLAPGLRGFARRRRRYLLYS